MSTSIDYLVHIRAESERFGRVLAATEPTAAVPTCPGWSAADVLWHLTEVHLFWAEIVHRRLQAPDEVVDPVRPESYGELLALREQATDRLVAGLRRSGARHADVDVVGGAVIGLHRPLAGPRSAHAPARRRAGGRRRTGGGRPPYGRRRHRRRALDLVRVAPGVVHLHGRRSALDVVAADTGRRWRLHAGQMRGTSPDTGKTYDERSFQVETGAAPTGTVDGVVTGAAADLDRWLWGRGDAAGLTRHGHPALLAAFDGVVAAGVR